MKQSSESYPLAKSQHRRCQTRNQGWRRDCCRGESMTGSVQKQRHSFQNYNVGEYRAYSSECHHCFDHGHWFSTKPECVLCFFNFPWRILASRFQSNKPHYTQSLQFDHLFGLQAMDNLKLVVVQVLIFITYWQFIICTQEYSASFGAHLVNAEETSI